MKAMVIVLGEKGGTLELRDLPCPEPGPGELLVRVKAVGLNRADTYQLKGTYQTEKTSGGPLAIAGLEAVGEVAGMGKEVSGFQMGDRIMGMCPGAYAEFAILDHRLAMAVPARLRLGRGSDHPDRLHDRAQRPDRQWASAGW